MLGDGHLFPAGRCADRLSHGLLRDRGQESLLDPFTSLRDSAVFLLATARTQNTMVRWTTRGGDTGKERDMLAKKSTIWVVVGLAAVGAIAMAETTQPGSTNGLTTVVLPSSVTSALDTRAGRAAMERGDL